MTPPAASGAAAMAPIPAPHEIGPGCDHVVPARLMWRRDVLLEHDDPRPWWLLNGAAHDWLYCALTEAARVAAAVPAAAAGPDGEPVVCLYSARRGARTLIGAHPGMLNEHECDALAYRQIALVPLSAWADTWDSFGIQLRLEVFDELAAATVARIMPPGMVSLEPDGAGITTAYPPDPPAPFRHYQWAPREARA